jgi:hypothetical protein
MIEQIWLSIDFDFFSPEAPEWDWGHLATSNEELVWTLRAKNLKAMGLDPVLATYSNNPSFDTFWDILNKNGYDFSRVKKFGISDCHSEAMKFYGVDWTGRSKPGRTLLNIDAHHDLGYGIHDLSAVDSGNWHIALHKHRPKLISKILYPTWEKQESAFPMEITALHVMDHLDKSRVSAAKWSEEEIQKTAGKVDGVFICRSSLFVPPWKDYQFIDFVSEAGMITGMKPTLYGIIDPMIARPFDMRKVEEDIDMEKCVAEPQVERESNERHTGDSNN